MFTHNGSENVTESETNLETSSYENAVKDFIQDEKQHLHNMNMISKVFLEKINIVLPINENEVSRAIRKSNNSCSGIWEFSKEAELKWKPRTRFPK